MINLNSNKTLVTGGTGLLGSALKKEIPNAIFIGSKDYDLTKNKQTLECFLKYVPEYVIHLAAVSNSVVSSADNQANIFYKNCKINLNVLDAARKLKVEKLLSTIDYSAYPSKVIGMARTCMESELHDGSIIDQNTGYGYSNRMLEIQSRLYKKQYKCNFITCIINNIYGEDDYFGDDARVVPAIIYKTLQAIKNNQQEVNLHGISETKRQFSYSQDIAKMIINLMNGYNMSYPINIGNPIVTTIGSVSSIVKKELKFNGQYTWSKNFQIAHKREMSTYKQNSYFSSFRWTPINDGIQKTIEWYKEKK